MEADITIKGRVQGVFFRANAKEMAEKLNLSGWIKNESDGTVSACVQGEKANIQAFIDWCHQGPPPARVESVQVTWKEGSTRQFTSFDIHHAKH